VGSPVQVTTTSTLQLPVTAKVTSVFPFVDQGPRTGVVEALVDNAARRFLPGQYVTMRFVMGERADALMVPAPAVVRMGGKATVWVAKEGRAEPRAVTTGLESPNRVEIRDGLTGDERVIARGSEGLYAGARVADVSGPAPASSPAPDEQKDMPGMPGMKQPTEKPSTPKGGAHGGH
jgi:membrane fusion protein (multidrug efflux system)